MPDHLTPPPFDREAILAKADSLEARHVYGVSHDLRAAIAEIDRLTAERDQLRNALDAIGLNKLIAERDRLRAAVERFIRTTSADPDSDIPWATVGEWLDDFAVQTEAWREAEAERDRLRAELSTHIKRWTDYEKEYILPMFTWAEQMGFDLRVLVNENPGKNCAVLLFEKLRADLAAVRAAAEPVAVCWWNQPWCKCDRCNLAAVLAATGEKTKPA